MPEIEQYPHLFAVAPMMELTDRHCRYFFRLFSQHTLLYTEMVHSQAILKGNREALLAYHPNEHPLALQIGGNNPYELAECAKIAEDYGYDEINLNIGCPSNRVQAGRFGACLMAEPQLVAECITAMQNAVKIPITVKTRLGIDNHDSYHNLSNFIYTVASGGCKIFTIHARKAWLKGLSPKENREIPPLRYEYVYQLKKDYPHLVILLNGGITELSAAKNHLKYVDGIMLGRAVYQSPHLLAEVDQRFYGETYPVLNQWQIRDRFLPYVQMELKKGTPLSSMTRHILGLFQNVPGARKWRRYLSEHTHKVGISEAVIFSALPAKFNE